MKIDSITSSVKRNTDGDFDTVKQSDAQATVNTEAYNSSATVAKVEQNANIAAGDDQKKEEDSDQKKAKDPTSKTIASVMSEANQKLSKTRCEYSYDEPTKRVSIKVYDKTTDELIREVPPEKSLEMLQRMWELAGLIVDEKR